MDDRSLAIRLLDSINCEILAQDEHPPPLHRLSAFVEKEKLADGEKLTVREREVLLLLAKGFSYAESSDFLGCKVSTLQTHVKRIYRKLQVNSKSEAVFEAQQLGILEL